MSVGAWEPEKASAQDNAAVEIKRELLQQFINIMQSSASLSDSLTNEALQASYLIRLPAPRWLEESAHWDDEQLWQLIQFFTLAEQQLSGWDAGAESAVIPLAKALRQRRAPLVREQLLWIRQHSDNRYLPYGPL